MLASAETEVKGPAPAPAKELVIPADIPFPDADGKIYIPMENGTRRATTLNPYLQMRLQSFIKDRGNPVAAAVVADVRTGRILAMVQGKSPESWGASGHSALHAKFPAASLFKTVTTAAAIEVSGYDTNTPIGLIGGCQNVNPNGIWMQDYNLNNQRRRRGAKTGMSLRKAYGLSCNNFFAKLAIDEVGIGALAEYAQKFGYGLALPADFTTETSYMNMPAPQNSSAYTVGRFAAGFGPASTSAVHVAWQMIAIANDGISRPLVLFSDTLTNSDTESNATMESRRVVDADTARQMLDIMDATVRGGTASSAFKRGHYKKLRNIVGGKTGTLTGNTPAGLTTLFSGIAPIDSEPEVVVATIVLLQDRWIIKAPILAAEAFSAYFDMRNNNVTSSIAEPIERKITGKTKHIKTTKKNRKPENKKIARNYKKRTTTH